MADEFPLAAYRLGYTSREMRAWLPFCWRAAATEWIEDPWGGFPGSIKQIREARLVLAHEIHPNVFVELGAALDQLDVLFNDLSERLAERDNWIAWGDGLPPGEDLLLSLGRLADRALGEGHRSRVWFAFGAALGDFRLGLEDPQRLALLPTGLEPPPDFRRVVESAGMLPEEAVCQVPLLDSLVKLSSCFHQKGQGVFFHRFLTKHNRSGRLHTKADGPVPLDNFMVEFNSRIQEGLGQLKCRPNVSASEYPDSAGNDRQLGRRQGTVETPETVAQSDQATPNSPPPPAKAENPRDRLMYDEYQKGTKLGEIAVRVKEVQDWEHFDTTSGVLAAVKRFAHKHSYPLTRRHPKRKIEAGTREGSTQ